MRGNHESSTRGIGEFGNRLEAALRNPESEAEKSKDKYFVGQVLEDISFVEQVNSAGKPEFVSRAPNRKIIILKNGSSRPEQGRGYSVRVVENVKPERNDAGKLIVEFYTSEKEPIYVSNDMVHIGNEKTPVFKSKAGELKWSVEGEQFRENGQTMVEVYFKRSDGLELRPGIKTDGKVRFEDKDKFIPLEEYKALKKPSSKGERAAESEYQWVNRALRHLNNLATNERDQALDRYSKFVETPYVVETMGKLTRLFNNQLERKQGIVILEGDAGTGKNLIVDHFAYLTKRPLFRFTCSAGKDEQDMRYLLEYDTRRGTYRINSTVIEALQTPGAILEFDEINTLKPETAKSLNSLFDQDRTLYSGEDRHQTKAAEDVILVGLQNYQHYMGVKPLAETIKSRARIMEIKYPPFRHSESRGTMHDLAGRSTSIVKETYRPDEALIVRQYVQGLKGFSQKEFTDIWNNIVNREKNPAVDLVNSKIDGEVKSVKEIIEIANKIRDAYRAYFEGKSEDEVKLIFSLRESIECGYELEHVKLTADEKASGITKAKKAVMEVVLPKIPLGRERVFLESAIQEA